MQDPSIQDNPLNKQCNTSTSYANTCTSCNAAPLTQTPATQSTCCLCKPLHEIPAKGPHLSDTPTTDRTQTRNLSKFRPNFQPKFPTQTHVDFSIEPQHIQNLTNKHTHTKCYAIC